MVNVNAGPLTPSPQVRTPMLTARALFDSEKLRFPPVPPQLAASLCRQDGPFFSTRPLQTGPYHLDRLLAEVAAHPELPAYAIAGFDGRGTHGWAVHYCLVSTAVALFLQLRWGGAYVDPEPARAHVAAMFDWAEKLQAKLDAAHGQGKIPPGWRLQVAASRLGTSGWRWLVPGRDNTGVPWQPAGGMKATLLQMLDDVLGGRLALQ